MRIRPHPQYDVFQARMRRLREACAPWSGVIYRSVSLQYASAGNILSGVGSRKVGARWTPVGAFKAVYGSLTPEGAMKESLAYVRYRGFDDADALPRVFVAIRSRLHRVLDVTRHARILGVSMHRMREENWRAAQENGRESTTQALGRAAFAAHIEAILVPSSASSGDRNLIIFPERLLARSAVEVLGASKLRRHQDAK